MSKSHVFVAICIVLTNVLPAIGQQQAVPKLPSDPVPVHALTQINLQSLWLAKVASDGKGIRFVKPIFKTEVKEFVVKKAGGDEAVPINVLIPDGTKRYIIPIDELVAKKLDGTDFPASQLAKYLKNPQQVFVSSIPDFPGIDVYYQSVFKPDTILIRIPSESEVDAKYSDLVK